MDHITENARSWIITTVVLMLIVAGTVVLTAIDGYFSFFHQLFHDRRIGIMWGYLTAVFSSGIIVLASLASIKAIKKSIKKS